MVQRNIHSPADGRLVGTAPVRTRAQVRALAAELRSAQPAWADLGVAGRVAWMGRWRDWLLDNERRLTELLQAESGKSTNDAGMELPIAYEVINYYCRHAERFLAPSHPRPHSPLMALKRLELQYHPYGLVGLITPWNGPIGNPLLDLPAAMIAGCAVLCKPSEFTPLALAECIRGWREEIGAPPILGCATGAGETGAAVVDAVDMVHFTGSGRTGQAPVYDRFVSLVTEKTLAIRQGDDAGGAITVDIGAMATAGQVDIVERHVADALARGARALTGGHRSSGPHGSGLYYEPTVLVDVDHSMACMREETFGPTIPIMRVSGAAEAVALANDSAYGLSASVWTQDRHAGETVAAALNAGAVNINNVMINLFQLPLPHHGWNDSGIGGRQGGAAGIRKYCREKAVVSERAAARSEIHWYPATPRKARIQRLGARFMAARDWRRRLGRPPEH